MKWMMVPPAQAEALFDAWHEDEWGGESPAVRRSGFAPQGSAGPGREAAEAPWRDDPDESANEPTRRPTLAAPSFGPAP